MTNIKELSKDIKRYYEISIFINKYITLISAFLLSLLIIVISNVQSTNVLAYGSDINKGGLKSLNNVKSKIWINTDWFNKKSKYIKSTIIFTKTDVEADNIKLWYGVFKDIKWIYFPSNIIIDNEKYKKFILNKNSIWASYVTLIKNSKDYKTELKIPKLKVESDESIMDKYNLDCIDTIMYNTPFCEYNKNKLIFDLTYKNTFDISSNLYEYLFNSIDKSSEDKCSIITSIYFNKYNYSRIKSILESNCDDVTISRINKADSLVDILPDSKLFNIKKEYDSSAVYYTQLINQTKYIIDKDKIPNELVVSYITLIQKWIEKNYINDPSVAEILIYTLKKYILDKLDNKLTIKNINTLLNWDDALWTKWLLSFVSNKKIIDDDYNIYWDTDDVVKSTREIFKNIIKENFRNEIVLTDKVKLQNNNNKVLLVSADILLIYKNGSKFVTKKIPVKFKVTDLQDTTFNIEDLVILKDEINDYLWDFPKKYDTFEELYSLLKDRLYAPLVKNDWSKTSRSELNLCKRLKMKNKRVTCYKNYVILSSKDLWYDGNIKIKLLLDENLRISKAAIAPWNYYIELDNLIKEKVKINKSWLEKAIKLKLSKLENKSFTSVSYMIKKIFTYYIEKLVQNKIWLKKWDVDRLESKFKKYLWAQIELIRKQSDWKYNIYFIIWKTMFLWEYNYKRNNIEKIWLVNPKKAEARYTCSGLELKLSNINSEVLNWFKSNPIEFMKTKCPTTVEKYLKDTKQVK